MADTDITICNGALGRLGVSSITNFTDDDKSKICGAIYPKYANMLLSMYPWHFARKKSGALSTTTAPDNVYTYAYSLPADLLTVHTAYNSGEVGAIPLSRGFEIFANTIHTDETSLYVDYIYTVDEDLWPDYFQVFAMTALASVLAIPITEDETKENFYRQMAFGTPGEGGRGGMFKMTKNIDSKQQPAKSFKGQSLLGARLTT